MEVKKKQDLKGAHGESKVQGCDFGGCDDSIHKLVVN